MGCGLGRGSGLKVKGFRVLGLRSAGGILRSCTWSKLSVRGSASHFTQLQYWNLFL